MVVSQKLGYGEGRDSLVVSQKLGNGEGMKQFAGESEVWVW